MTVFPSCGNKDSQKNRAGIHLVATIICVYYTIYIYIYVYIYIYIYIKHVFLVAHLSKNSDPPWFEKLGCICLKTLFGLKFAASRSKQHQCYPGFFSHHGNLGLFSPKPGGVASAREPSLSKECHPGKRKCSKIQIIWYQYETCGLTPWSQKNTSSSWANFLNFGIRPDHRFILKIGSMSFSSSTAADDSKS